MSCSSNPECGWCPSDGICYLRTLTSKCASNLKTQKCPGICPTLPDCQSCNLFSSSNNNGASGFKKSRQNHPSVSQIIDDLQLNQCAWCSNLQQCLPKHSTPDPCGTHSRPEN